MNDGKNNRSGRAGSTGSEERTARARLTPEVQNLIGSHLRNMYSEVISEGVPDRFAKLLEDLERGTNAKE